MKIIAPAVAASGLPVMATQFLPCRTGFSVLCAGSREAAKKSKTIENSPSQVGLNFMVSSFFVPVLSLQALSAGFIYRSGLDAQGKIGRAIFLKISNISFQHEKGFCYNP
jgi:hypothetical protein